MNTSGVAPRCISFRERRDGQVNLADFNYPDGEYKVSITNENGDVISTDNKIIKENRKVELYRYYDGSDIPIVAQSYKIPMDDINQKVLQFIMENCPDITKIFIDSIPSINNRLIEETEMVFVEKLNKDNCISENAELLITPISKTYNKTGPCSRKDWDEQQDRYKRGEQMMWDDSKHNKSKKGDVIAIWKYEKGVSFHHIEKVENTQSRSESWSQNVGQTDRNVILLSPEFSYFKWDKWIEMGGHKRCMGTSSITTSKDKILNELIKEEKNKKDIKRVESGAWVPIKGYDSIDLNKQVVKFKDIIEFSEKYMIVKGFMQVGKTNFIISAAVWFMLNGMSSVIVLRNCNSDKDQLIRRVKEYNARIQAFLGYNHSNKFVIEAVSNGEIKPKHFTGKDPVIAVVIANTSPLKKINNMIENTGASKKFALFFDEVDFIDSDGTLVQKELDKLREHCFCSYGVSATILDSAFKRDIEKGNVTILSTPENYKSVPHFKMMHLPSLNDNKESCLVTTIGDDIMTKDNNVIDYLDEFNEKNPHYVELYDDEKYGEGEQDIRPECHHPVLSLLHVSITNSPNLQLLSQIQTGYGYPAMYFMGGGTGSGCVYLSLLSEKKPITLSNGKKSKIIKNEKYADIIVKGEFHVFYGASPALVLEWLKNNGGVKLFPRIIILAGVLAGRCQSFGSADFNSCLSNKTLGWHLTEMYLSASKTMDQPELIQLAGRLCVVARDNIQPLLYATKRTCMDLIKSFQIQEELIDRARKSEGINSIGKIMESLPIYTKKFVSKRSLTKKSEFKLNLSTKEEDLQAGGWNKRDMYCSKDVNGGRIISEKLQMSETLERILTKPIQTNSHIQNENATWSDRVQRNENETCISYLKRVISHYIEYDGNENTWRSAKDWRDITGICGFESDSAHHLAIMTKFVEKGFLERNLNQTRVNI
jgi:hypothetical protein